MSNKFKKYGKSKNGNFEVLDKIGVPHPYCITPKHLEYNDSMYLDIEGAEAKGAVSDICKKINSKDYGRPILTYGEHEQALLVSCLKNPAEDEYKKEI